jgi:hypothetical protein
MEELKLSRTALGDDELLLFASNDVLKSFDISETKVTAEGVRKFLDARRARHASAGTGDQLFLSCDFPEIIFGTPQP